MSQATKTSTDLPTATQTVYKTLEGLDPADMVRVLRAALILLGQEATIELE